MYTKKETKPIKNTAGKIQISKVIIANPMPPRFSATKAIVCVEEGPGSIWQNELYSSNSSSVTSLRSCANVFNIMPM
ncbi:MAG: hypothetical protein EBR55_03495 [Chitinophagia bacterium]|nr:hypothetical protein [Chitinophagia bacterium]